MNDSAPEYVRIFDTTLRDGEQSPGASMTAGEKLEVARVLARLGVDVIEAGFPAASPDDFDAVRAIADDVGTARRGTREPPIVCALARAAQHDIARAWQAIQGAARPRIHTFIATSPLHMEHKLRMAPAEVLARASRMVAAARAACADVEFSAEDATRSDRAFLHEVLAAAIEAGATTINVPDTVGYATPDEMFDLVAGVRASVKGADRVVLSVHCHDDLGLATANTLAALRAGARQAEVTINGIGERAGNAALEEVVMAIRTRAAALGLVTGIDATQLVRASRSVSACTRMPVQANKAIVGANAFAHESGIHQDGMLKHARTYEIMRPEDVGATQTRLVLGKHSGRAALRARLAEIGHALGDEALDRVFARFKALADKKKDVSDADLDALAADESPQRDEAYVLEGVQIACGTASMATATVRLQSRDGQRHVEAAVGTGPVDAAFKAIDRVVRAPLVLLEFAVRAVTEGIDALGEVTVRIQAVVQAEGAAVGPPGAPWGARVDVPNGGERALVFHGHGADTDILVASAKAYVAAINRMLASQGAPLPRAASRTNENEVAA
jgi:2-isopropylmalate synthase